MQKVGNSTDIQCLLCGLKGHKVTSCRKLPRAQELIKQDKQQYWNKKKGYTNKHATHSNNRHQMINEVDDSTPIDEIENQEGDILIKITQTWMRSISQQVTSPKRKIKRITTMID